MYHIAKNVLLSGRYELSDILGKLDALWLRGELTDEQHTELMELARTHADPLMTATLTRRVEAVELRLARLEQAAGGEDYPAFAEGRRYRSGDRISFGGKRYVCKLPTDTLVCVWSPSVYPAYWQEV